MRFQTKRIYTGKTIKTSKQGNEYILLSFLNDDGQTFTVVSDVDVTDDIKQLDEVNVEFEIKAGRYINMRVKRIWK